MEYSKLFDNNWYKKDFIDCRIFFKEYLNRLWWQTSSEDERLQWLIEAEREKESLDRARISLGLFQNNSYQTFTTPLKNVSRSKYW